MRVRGKISKIKVIIRGIICGLISLIVWFGYKDSSFAYSFKKISIGEIIFIWMIILSVWGIIFSLIIGLTMYFYYKYKKYIPFPSIEEIGIIILIWLFMSLISFPS